MKPSRSSRAGQTETHRDGYRVFLPLPLPPEGLDSGLYQTEFDRASRALGRLDAIGELLPNPDIFLAMYIRKEALLSAQIEGTQASLDDVLNREMGLPSERSDVGDVLNYITAMKDGIEALHEYEDTEPFRKGFVCSLHRTIIDDTRGDGLHAGGYRKTQNWIGRPGPQGPDPLESAAYVPPPPEHVEALMTDLLAYMSLRNSTPGLVQAGVAHAQFETIHPFVDGNGRLGRLLIVLLLCQRRNLRQPLLYLSAYLKANKREYYESLMSVRLDGDWEGWLRFFFSGVASAAEEGFTTALRVRDVLAEDAVRVDALLARKVYTRPLLDILSRYPRVSSSFVHARLGCAMATVISTLGDLEGVGVVQEVTGRERDRIWVYGRYLAALDPAAEG